MPPSGLGYTLAFNAILISYALFVDHTELLIRLAHSAIYHPLSVSDTYAVTTTTSISHGRELSN